MDPYHHWLGIPKEDQPPHHYRLLGLNLWEANRDVIASAADRQMSFVRQHQADPEAADISQKILNELMTARLCLLNPEKKAEYDRQLRASLAASATPPPRRKRRAAATAAPAVPLSLPATPTRRPEPQTAESQTPSAQLLPATANAAAWQDRDPRRAQPLGQRMSLRTLLLLSAAGVAAAGLLLGVGISLAVRGLHTEPPTETLQPTASLPGPLAADIAPDSATPDSSAADAHRPLAAVQEDAAELIRPETPPQPDASTPLPSYQPGATPFTRPRRTAKTPKSGRGSKPRKIAPSPPLELTFAEEPASLAVAGSENLLHVPGGDEPPAAMELASRDAGLAERSDLAAPAPGPSPASPAVEDPVVPLIQEAQKLVGQKRFEDARKQLLQVNLVQRDEPQASFYLGLLAALVDHDPTEARKQFARARKAAVAELACLNNLAILEVRTADVPQAVRYWKEAVQLEPAPEVCHNISLLLALAERNRLTVPAAMQRDLQQQLDAADVTLPTARGGWRFMDYRSDPPASMAWAWPNLADRACLVCNGLGTANCPVKACSRGRVRVNTVDTIVLPGRQVVRKDRLVPVTCSTCRGTGRVSCPFCYNGIDRDL